MIAPGSIASILGLQSSITSVSEVDAAVYAGLPKRSLDRLARVLAHAEYVWDDPYQAREWMSRPHRELQDSTPLNAARTELGARRVEVLLDKLFYGLPV